MADRPLDTPVALLVFNRPETTARVLAAIREARPRRLLIVGDGPRADRPGERELCLAARAAAERVDWHCRVETEYSDVNLGCGARVSSGLDWVFDRVPEAIVLEDDCLPHPSFFRFCEELLERYRGEERVMHVSGVNYEATPNPYRRPARLRVLRRRLFGPRGPSYYFSRYPHVWGWASWSRAWSRHDAGMTAWREAPDRERLIEPDLSEGERSVWRDAWDRVSAGAIDTWDYQWSFACRSSGALSVTPRRNLVSNIGFGAGAHHTTDPGHPFAEQPLEGLRFPLVHPPDIVRDARRDAHTAFLHFGAPAPQDLQPPEGLSSPVGPGRESGSAA